MNHVTLTGVLTADFSVRTSRKSNSEFLTGNLAVNGARNSSTNELDFNVDAEFYSLTVFSETVQKKAKLFTKGIPVLVTGELERQFYVNPQTGKKTFTKRIIVSDIIPYAQSEELTQVICNAIQGFISQKRSGTFTSQAQVQQTMVNNSVITHEQTHADYNQQNFNYDQTLATSDNSYGLVNNFNHERAQQILKNTHDRRQSYDHYTSSKQLNSDSNQSLVYNVSDRNYDSDTIILDDNELTQFVTDFSNVGVDLESFNNSYNFNCFNIDVVTSHEDSNNANFNSYNQNIANTTSQVFTSNITLNKADFSSVSEYVIACAEKHLSPNLTREEKQQLFIEKHLERKKLRALRRDESVTQRVHTSENLESDNLESKFASYDVNHDDDVEKRFLLNSLDDDITYSHQTNLNSFNLNTATNNSITDFSALNQFNEFKIDTNNIVSNDHWYDETEFITNDISITPMVNQLLQGRLTNKIDCDFVKESYLR